MRRGAPFARVRGAVAVVAAACAGVLACSLTTSFEELTSGPGADDAAVIIDGAPATETAIDASDAGSTADAADGGSFCSAQSGLYLCADFDDGGLPPSLAESKESNSDIDYVTGDARSAPYAVVFTAKVSEDPAGAALRGTLPDGTQRVTVELDVKIDELGGTSDYDLLTFGAGSPEVGIQVNANRELAFDEDFPKPTDAGSTGAVTLAGRTMTLAWTHLKWTLRVDGAALTTQLFVDGAPVATKVFAADTFTKDGAIRVEIGDGSQSPLSKQWRIRMDNVTFDLR